MLLMMLLKIFNSKCKKNEEYLLKDYCPHRLKISRCKNRYILNWPHAKIVTKTIKPGKR